MLKGQSVIRKTDFVFDNSVTELSQSPFVVAKANKAKALLSKVNLPPEDTLVDKIAKNAKISKSQAASALDAVIITIESALVRVGKVTLVGFGTFSLTEQTAKTTRHPRTGRRINRKPQKIARFKASEELLKKVNR